MPIEDKDLFPPAHYKESQLEADMYACIKLYGLPEPEREYRFHPTRKWRFDFAWPRYKIAVECEGGIWIRGAHNRGNHFESDARKYNAANKAGWKVLRYSAGMVRSFEAINDLKELLTGHHLHQR